MSRSFYVVTVRFGVRPEAASQFRAAMIENASTSLNIEPGCHVFDVCESPDTQEIFLYEVYADRAAFDAHLASPHFQDFSRITADWVISKEVSTFSTLLTNVKEVSDAEHA